MKIKYLIAALLLTPGCASINIAPKNHSLEGVWSLEDFGSGNYSFTQFALLADNRKCALTFDVYPDGVRSDAYISHWHRDNDILVTTYGANTAGIEEGFVMRDRIDFLNANKMKLFMLKPAGQRPESHQKLSNVNPLRLCETAQKIIDFQTQPVGLKMDTNLSF